MNTLTTKTLIINRNTNEVYQFISNMENFKKWFPEVIKIESDNSMEHGAIGKKYLETVKIPFKGESKIALEVVRAEKNKAFSTEGDFSPLLPKMTITLARNSADSTTLTWSMESRNNQTLFKLLLLPIFRKIMSKRAAIGIQNLKNVLETV